VRDLARKIVRRVLNPLVFTGQQKIVIASTGRAGSTVLFDTIRKGLICDRLGPFARGTFGAYVEESCSGFVARMADIPKSPFVVYKTHDIFTNLPDCKFIFVHGDPLDSAMSVQKMVKREGIEWFHTHQYNLSATGEYDDLFDKDVLNFAGQVRSWMGARRGNVFIVAYADLWEKQVDLGAFLGFPICLPERRERSPKTLPTNINAKLFEQLRGLVDERRD
jgi:hypothetical protein